jgi:serine/threonine protein kinase/DNA-binding CsgD family transcriptional regulator
MGTVYQAHDETLDRTVAIKFLPPHQIANSEASARFLREARVVAGLSHPNIMTLYDVGREGDWHYLVLEHIPGQDLHTLTANPNNPLSEVEAIRIVRDVLKALVYAHTQRVVHRDIKPENLMITPDGRVKVTDFGLSVARGATRLTEENAIIGTILYLAPEVVEGQSAGNHSDLYAVGAVLYELLTGQPPFVGDTPMAILSQILTAPVTPPRSINPGISIEVERVILKLLAKYPHDRYPSAQAVLDDLSDSEIKPTLEGKESGPTQLSEAMLLYTALEDVASTVEAERRRLAHLLQSNILDPLNLLLAQANAYEQTLSVNPAARMAVSVLTSLARQVMQQVRDLEANLHPSVLDNLGLEPALENLANQIMRAYGLQVTLSLERLPERPPPPIELAIFRVAQAALERAIQTRASQAAMRLDTQHRQLCFQLNDNGIASTPAAGLFGAARLRVEQLGGTFETKMDTGFELTITFPQANLAQLTPREMDVIRLLAEGLSNKQIARHLSVTPRTVNFHLDNIYAKLGVNSRTEAAIYALRQGWVRVANLFE